MGRQSAIVQNRNEKQAGNPNVRLRGRSGTGRVNHWQADRQEINAGKSRMLQSTIWHWIRQNPEFTVYTGAVSPPKNLHLSSFSSNPFLVILIISIYYILCQWCLLPGLSTQTSWPFQISVSRCGRSQITLVNHLKQKDRMNEKRKELVKLKERQSRKTTEQTLPNSTMMMTIFNNWTWGAPTGGEGKSDEIPVQVNGN